MDVRVGCPAVPEEAAGLADERDEDGGWETAFWNRDVIVAEGGALVVGVLNKAGQYPQEEADKDRCLEEASIRDVRIARIHWCVV